MPSRARTAALLGSFALGASGTLGLACTALLSGEDFTGGSKSTEAGSAPPGTADGAAATADGAPATTGSSLDAGTDPGDADAGPFCATRASSFFCDDFDDHLRPYQQVWPDEAIQGTSTVGLATDQRTSAPNSLLIQSSSSGGDLASVSRTLTFAKPMTDITVEMSIFIDAFAPEPTAGATMMPIFFAPTDALSELGVRIIANRTPGSVRQQQELLFYPADGGDGTFLQADIAPPLATGRWIRIVHHVALGANPTCTLSMDGVVVSTLSLSPDFTATTSVSVSLGFQYTSGPTSAVKMWTDDVVIDAH